MAITNLKITPLPHEGKQFWIDYYIQESDPNDIAIFELTQGFKAIVDKQYETLVSEHRWFAAKTNASVYAKSSSVIRTVKPQTQVSLHNFIVSQYLHCRFDPTLNHTTFNNKNPLECRIVILLNGNDRQAVMRVTGKVNVTRLQSTKASERWLKSIVHLSTTVRKTLTLELGKMNGTQR